MPEPRPLRPNDPREVGGFRLTARIGEGAQGSVYLGESDTGQPVAAKLLRVGIGHDDRARTLFERELAAARRVAPFCTARILAAGVDGDVPYMVSEYIEGPSLREQISEHGVATGGELVRLAIGTATALAAIHQAGVVHRDLKPANVLLGEDGPRVIDFGIARPLDATSATLTGAVGTPAYMAPEQVAGAAGGPPLDMFAWACTIVFAANGAPPFGGDNVAAIMQRVLYGEPELGALTGELRALVASCLAKDPAARPTALHVLQRLLNTGPSATPGANAGADTDVAVGADADVAVGADADVAVGADADVAVGADADVAVGADADVAVGADADVNPDADGRADLLAEGTSAAALPPGELTPLMPATFAAGAPAPPSPDMPGLPWPGTQPGAQVGGAPPPLPAGFPSRTNPSEPGRSGRRLLVAGAAAAALLVIGGVFVAVLLRETEKGGGPEGRQTAGQSSTRTCRYSPATPGKVKDVGTPPSQVPAKQPQRATIKTNLGALVVQLDAAKAPCTVNSLAHLAGKRYYDNTACHRLTTSPSLKILQCGDPSGTGTGGPSYSFADEITGGTRYTRGTVAMANAGPGTNGSQFFILYADSASLPPNYTVFGRVTSGMEVVDKVARAGAGETSGMGPGDGRPKQKITITELRTVAG
ncbi:peptidylprolyl isomerase [Spirillospora sp. NBC_00431]